MIYITSDFHLTHENIIKYVGRFEQKITYQEYANKILNYLRSVLKKDDTLIYLGDLDCGPHKNIENLKRYFDLIPGKKIFIRGNHDKWLDDEDIHYIGFQKVCDIIKYKDILICHYPLDEKSVIPKEAPAYLKRIDLTNIKKIYHGHVHNNRKTDCSDGIERINCCIDRNPNEIGELIKLEI